MAFDFCVLGAGLAGLSLTDKLSETGASVVVVDPNGVAGGASGTPLGLVNPATGRFATKTWKAEECYQSILETLEKVQRHSQESFYKKTGVLRPALDTKIATRMKANFDSTSWPKDWCYWLDEKVLKALYPGINCVGGGVWLPIGLSVKLPEFLTAYSNLLKSRNVEFITNKEFDLSQSDNSWCLKFNDSNIEASTVITASGIESNGISHWDFLTLHPVKGQIAIFETETPFPYDASVSALGYFSEYDAKSFAAGSTYEHHFEHTHTDPEGLNYILKKLALVMPSITETIVETTQWAGIRASTPDRMPILGQHPDFDNFYIFTGLGSKGLLFSSYLANALKDLMFNTSSLPPEVDIKRFLK